MKLQRYEDLQISPKTEDVDFVLTSGILSKAFETAAIFAIRFAYETATINVSALQASEAMQGKGAFLSADRILCYTCASF